MRGKADKFLIPSTYVRITPAYAGKRTLTGGRISLTVGSPPPMRGKDRTRFVLKDGFRITPAYAGKRRCGRRNGLCVQDHPRLCGEKKDRPPFSGCRLGSPPPMRGKVRNYNQRKGTSRITPAYAGKSA